MAGDRLRLIVRSHDRDEPDPMTGQASDGRTIESYEPGTNTLLFAPDNVNTMWFPVRPVELQGVRLG